MVSEKVSDSVSEKFGIGKKFRIRFRLDFGYCHTLIMLQMGNMMQLHNQANNNETDDRMQTSDGNNVANRKHPHFHD